MFTEVQSDKTKDEVLFILNNSWNKNYTGFSFPLPTSIALARTNLDQIKCGNYIFTLKDINSKRAVFILYKDSQGENKQFLVLRDSTVLETTYQINDYYFSGTIFDVSILDEKIVVYDTFMIGGFKVNNMNYTTRHSAACKFSEGIDKLECCTLYNNLNEIDVKDDQELHFIPVEDHLISGINFHAFKWRPSNVIEFGLLCEEKENEIFLYATNFKKNILFSKIKGKYIVEIKKLENYKDNCIVNTKFVDKELEFICVDVDKEHPSSLRQIENALFIKNENITFHDLF